jgi:hypothetical protein
MTSQHQRRASFQAVKTFRDPRGTLFEPLTDDELLAQKNVHVVLTRPNEVRGNHSHRTAVETTTVVGPCLIRLKEEGEAPICTTLWGPILSESRSSEALRARLSLRVISFKSSQLFKRGIWLSAAALIVFVAAPSALDGQWLRNPLPGAIAIAILCAALIYFFWKTQTHRLADEVQDCGDSLRVLRGRREESIPLSNVSAAEVSSSSGFHRITVRLRARSKFGVRIEFLPQASLWSNLSAIRDVAADLTERAKLSAPRAPPAP